jgi:hypothetical protein
LKRSPRKDIGRVRDEQREFIMARNKSFGRVEYNLKQDMEERLHWLRGLYAAN